MYRAPESTHRGIVSWPKWFKRSSLFHMLLKPYMYSKYKPSPVSPEDREIYDQVMENGYAIIPDFFDRATTEQMLLEVEKARTEVLENHIEDYFYHPRGHERIANIENYAPTTKRFFYNDFIQRMGRCYVSRDALAYRKEADYKYIVGRDEQANLAHFDDFRHRLKAFLFLSDVTEKNAPMIYYAGTHKLKAWRRRYNREFTSGGEEGRYGHFFPQEMDALCEKHGFEAVKLTVKAGTLFLGDFRGIHQGTVLQDGKRVLLNCTFGL